MYCVKRDNSIIINNYHPIGKGKQYQYFNNVSALLITSHIFYSFPTKSLASVNYMSVKLYF